MAVTDFLIQALRRKNLATRILSLLFLFSSNIYGQAPLVVADSLETKYEVLFDHEIDSQVKNKNQFLLLAAWGQKLSIEGNYKESNKFFEKAYLLWIDHLANRIERRGECYDDDHDIFMVLYFKAINYLSLGLTDDALVECRRMDEWVHEVNQRHQGRKFVEKDPLAYVMMGLIYEIGKDYDNSLISYNKAKQLFEQEYQGSFSKEIPLQLEKDISFVSSVAEEQKYSTYENKYGEMIFIWHNGRCPFKLNIQNEFRIKCSQGQLMVSNQTLMPYEDYLGNRLLPFYTIKQPNFWSGTLVANGKDFRCELLEDVTWYSVRTLQERLNQNGTHLWHTGEDWNTLPYNINYVRVPLQKGTNYFDFVIRGYSGSVKIHSFSCEGNGKTYFHSFTTLDSHDHDALNK